MKLNDYILETPSYGWADAEGNFIKPTFSQIFNEFLTRINIFKDSRNWLPFLGWFWILCLSPAFFLLFLKFLLFLGFF